MIVYADTSALVKKYVLETNSEETIQFLAQFAMLGTASLTHVEMAAALSKASRLALAPEKELRAAWRDFLDHRPFYSRLPVTTALVEKASSLA